MDCLQKLTVSNRTVNPSLVPFLLKLYQVEGCYEICQGTDSYYIGKSKNLFARVCESYYHNFLHRVNVVDNYNYVSFGMMNPAIRIYLLSDVELTGQFEKYLIGALQPEFNKQYKDIQHEEIKTKFVFHRTEIIPIYKQLT